jgi:hypothetical protein
VFSQVERGGNVTRLIVTDQPLAPDERHLDRLTHILECNACGHRNRRRISERHLARAHEQRKQWNEEQSRPATRTNHRDFLLLS